MNHYFKNPIFIRRSVVQLFWLCWVLFVIIRSLSFPLHVCYYCWQFCLFCCWFFGRRGGVGRLFRYKSTCMVFKLSRLASGNIFVNILRLFVQKCLGSVMSKRPIPHVQPITNLSRLGCDRQPIKRVDCDGSRQPGSDCIWSDLWLNVNSTRTVEENNNYA